MDNQHIKDVLAAIASVKSRVRKAMVAGDSIEVNRLMGDLTALEVCLVIETEKFVYQNSAA